MTHRIRTGLALVSCAAAACVVTVGAAAAQSSPPTLSTLSTLAPTFVAPEIGSGFRTVAPVVADRFMAVTGHPAATAVARDLLARGGSAVDAAIAAQLVLNLVEPQSSGIGGGAFLLHFDALTRDVVAYDGRETAPGAAGPDYLRFVGSAAGQAPVVPDARASGRSIGTPGLLRMLELAHGRHGRLTWPALFEPAVAMAEAGFAVSPRMAASIASAREQLARDPQAAAHFLMPDGTPKPTGTRLANPALADTLRRVAAGGADAFHQGEIAAAIVERIRAPTVGRMAVTPGETTLRDLADYRAVARPPVCMPYRIWEICGMPPPSSGGIAVAQTLGILENWPNGQAGPAASDRIDGRPGAPPAPSPSADSIHLLAEALRLAFADRNRYVADTDYVPLPGGSWSAMLDPRYLRERAALVSLQRSLGTAPAGAFGPLGGSDAAPRPGGTTHLTIVDGRGNVVSMTSSIEAAFGSYRMVRGFLLNNQLTDFSAVPADAQGPIANRVGPLKRPRSSMAPTLVFRLNPDGSRGDFVLATGSPGGAAIIAYVAKSLVATLDWGLDVQQAASLANVATFNGPATLVEAAHPGVDDRLVDALSDRGHQVSRGPLTSGLASIMRTERDGQSVLVGGADPRREYMAGGDRAPVVGADTGTGIGTSAGASGRTNAGTNADEAAAGAAAAR
jgi:gamma-glutamyltranspeptidase / glutathione hydrolase